MPTRYISAHAAATVFVHVTGLPLDFVGRMQDSIDILHVDISLIASKHHGRLASQDLYSF